MYPKRPALLVPTFIGAFIGSDDRLPSWQHAFKDPRAAEATELMVRLLRDRAAFEANLFDENNGFLVAASAFPYFYALVGERNPKQAPKAGSRSAYSALACDAFELIARQGPISKQKMQEVLGGSVSFPALDGALGELWSKLRITRVDYKASEGSVWDVLYRWAPDAVKEGVGLSVQEALTALLSKYLDCVIAIEQADLEIFFGNFIARSKVKDYPSMRWHQIGAKAWKGQKSRIVPTNIGFSQSSSSTSAPHPTSTDVASILIRATSHFHSTSPISPMNAIPRLLPPPQKKRASISLCPRTPTREHSPQWHCAASPRN